ncbi:unnamed protein product, partial [Pocillopora meandrina]
AITYTRKYQICELNNRTKEARPENFLSAPAWFYIRRSNSRTPLGSIRELPALSCHEIKASEGEGLNPTKKGKEKLIYCDMLLLLSHCFSFNILDMDECKFNISDSDVNANCTNTYGSHKCTCKVGYIGDGRSCSDIDECQKNTHDFHLNATCQNTNGSFFCTCFFGFNGNGRNCTDIDECSKLNICDEHASCSNNQGPYSCACNSRYNEDGLNCKGYIREMPTQCVPDNRCGAIFSGWLYGGHHTLANGEVSFNVCFTGGQNCCKKSINIRVKECGSYFIYNLQKVPGCFLRYCGTDRML